MSFKVKLRLGGKEFYVLRYDYLISREIDRRGLPSSDLQGSTINITIEGSADNSLFFDWASTNSERKDGSLVLFKRDTDATMYTLDFKGAYLVSYKEQFDSAGNEPVSLSLVISARSVRLGNSFIENAWS